MRKIYKKLISFLLAVSLLLCATVPSFAAKEEEYICELRLIYAEDYVEAMEIVSEGEFSDYKLLNENLNVNSDEIGVWLAYKTTTNIDDAITDIAVMQMNGGYTLGNYQEMIKESYEEYVAAGEVYLEAIEYFIEAYDAGHFLAESAFRQLNFYSGFDGREDERLGDVFYDGVDEYELATMFLEGNSYVLQNIRSLIAMGVSYNEDGTNYLRRVEMEVDWLQNDPDLYEDEDYEELAAMLAPTVTVFKEMFKELANYEEELNYEDDELTSLELKYMEYKAIAGMMAEIDYLDGKTLYQFCLNYEVNEDDYSSLYPLVAALNEGQLAMSHVSHYYDVVRYSMEVYDREELEETLVEYEEKYAETPFDIYTGVDRSIYDGSFALTSEASRADAYSENGISEAYFGESTALKIASYSTGIAFGTLLLWGAMRLNDVKPTVTTVKQEITNVQNSLADQSFQTNIDPVFIKTPFTVNADGFANNNEVVNYLLQKYAATKTEIINNLSTMSYADKMEALMQLRREDVFTHALNNHHMNYQPGGGFVLDATDDAGFCNTLIENYSAASKDIVKTGAKDVTTTATTTSVSPVVAAIYVVGGILMLYSAFRLGKTIYDHYHPDYEDVPLSMVDLVDTVDGDRYIKYDVVYNAETNEDGVYEAGDLNAFEGKRWNALYYTKSYEAGKPLLADSFSVSNDNNKAASGYTPVHRFGEVVCYDLNKYNFDGDTNIYLSVKQSKNDKSAVADVPEVVGSLFGAGYLFLAGGVGIVAGIGGALATQEIVKKKKTKADNSETEAEESADA